MMIFRLDPPLPTVPLMPGNPKCIHCSVLASRKPT